MKKDLQKTDLASFPEINPNPIIETDFSGNLHYINPAARKRFPDLAGNATSHLLFRNIESISKMFEDQGKTTFIQEVNIGDAWFHQTYCCILDSKRVRVYLLDITEVKKVEEALRKAHDELESRVQERTTELNKSVELLRFERKRFNKVLDTLPAYVVLLTPDHHVPFANQFFEKRFGKSDGKRCFEYLFNRTEPCDNCETYKVLKTNAPHHWEWTGPDNRDYDIYDFPFADADGSPLILEMGIDITEQKKAQDALRKANETLEQRVAERTEELQTIFNSVPAIVFYKDKENRFISTNKAFEVAMGMSKKMLKGKSLFELYPREQAEAHWRDDKKVIESGKAKNGIIESMKTSHGTRLLQTDKIPYKDERGNVVGVIGFSVDITERKQAEEVLRESREDLNRAQAVANIGSWRLNTQQNALLWSDETYRIFGIPNGTPMTYETFLAVIHPDDRGYVNQKWTAALNGEPYDIEHRIVVEEKVKWVREKAELEFDKKGVLLGGFGTTQDITGKKAVEEELAKERANLRTIFDIANVGMLLIGEDGAVKRVNDTISKWVGKDRSSSCGTQPGDVVCCVHALSNHSGCGHTSHCKSCPIRTAFERVFDSGGPVHGIEAEVLLSVGESPVRMWLDISADPVVIDGRKHAVLSMNNITERKVAEEKLKKSYEHLELMVTKRTRELMQTQKTLAETKRLSDIGTLAATVAHELRNPLAAMRMAAYNIKRKRINPNLDKHLDNIEKKIIESDQIINNLLFYSRIKPPTFENINMYNLINEYVESIKEQFKKRGVSIVVKLGPLRNIVVSADRLQAGELFTNILNNAYDAVSDRTGKIGIGGTVENNNSVKVYIKDNGVGMDKENLEKVYDPFFTTKAKGTGLGLSVCSQIVSLHNGTLNIESQKDKGTTVSITLPIGNNKS